MRPIAIPMLPIDLPDLDDEPIQLIFGHYDDWLWRDHVASILADANELADWECELTIAAEAVYAENFLSPN